jgi:hypothetical protein
VAIGGGITSVTSGVGYFMRVGNVINVSCQFKINPSATNALTTASINLPIARTIGNFTSVNQGFGNGSSTASADKNYAHIDATTGAQTMTLTFISSATAGDKSWFCTFQYSQINT